MIERANAYIDCNWSMSELRVLLYFRGAKTLSTGVVTEINREGEAVLN